MSTKQKQRETFKWVTDKKANAGIIDSSIYLVESEKKALKTDLLKTGKVNKGKLPLILMIYTGIMNIIPNMPGWVTLFLKSESGLQGTCMWDVGEEEINNIREMKDNWSTYDLSSFGFDDGKYYFIVTGVFRTKVNDKLLNLLQCRWYDHSYDEVLRTYDPHAYKSVGKKPAALTSAVTSAKGAATYAAAVSPSAAKTPVAETPVAETPAAKTPVAETLVVKPADAKPAVVETLVAKTPVAETPVAETPITTTIKHDETFVADTKSTGDAEKSNDKEKLTDQTTSSTNTFQPSGLDYGKATPASSIATSTTLTDNHSGWGSQPRNPHVFYGKPPSTREIAMMRIRDLMEKTMKSKDVRMICRFSEEEEYDFARYIVDQLNLAYPDKEEEDDLEDQDHYVYNQDGQGVYPNGAYPNGVYPNGGYQNGVYPNGGYQNGAYGQR